MISFYWPGQVIRLSVEYKDEQGALADPATAVIRVIPPSGAEITDNPTKDSVGLYHYDLPVTLPGRYQYRFEGTGGLEVSSEYEFRVRDTDFDLSA